MLAVCGVDLVVDLVVDVVAVVFSTVVGLGGGVDEGEGGSR